jgi:hypothetical protein
VADVPLSGEIAEFKSQMLAVAQTVTYLTGLPPDVSQLKNSLAEMRQDFNRFTCFKFPMKEGKALDGIISYSGFAVSCDETRVKCPWEGNCHNHLEVRQQRSSALASEEYG